VTLKIYDVAGKCMACLVESEQEEGSYVVEWEGKDDTGSSVASGIYFCRLTAGDKIATKTMVLLR
jgi:flagellar hook assembly protein FlgD